MGSSVSGFVSAPLPCGYQELGSGLRRLYGGRQSQEQIARKATKEEAARGAGVRTPPTPPGEKVQEPRVERRNLG